VKIVEKEHNIPIGVYISIHVKILNVVLICALKAHVKKLKIKIKKKFYLKNITFETFKALNAQFSKKNFYICLFNLCPKDTS